MRERAITGKGAAPCERDAADRLARLVRAAEALLELYEETGRIDFSTEQELEAAIDGAKKHSPTASTENRKLPNRAG